MEDTTVLLKQRAQTQAARLLVPATLDTMEMALPVMVRDSLHFLVL